MNDSTDSTTPSEPDDAGGPGRAARTDTPYAAIAQSSEFRRLRHRYRGFAFPATVAFMVWYLLFVISANWLPGFMNVRIAGHINIALVFGLLQFVSTFLIAWLYARHANRKLDPIAEQLNDRYRKEVGE